MKKRGLSVSEKVTLLAVGGGIGAVLALLLAPKPGLELREEIVDTTRKSLEKGRETAQQIGTRAGDYYETAREKSGELIDVTRDKAKQLTESAREKVSERGNTLADAIAAGKAAYYEEKRRTEAAQITTGRALYPTELGETERE